MVPGFSSSGARQATAMLIPYENFKGAVLGNQYQLQYFKVQDGHLGIYIVTNLRPRGSCASSKQGVSLKEQRSSGVFGHADDEVLEAKAFPLGQESQARRRRIKRICRSQNFHDEVEQSGYRFLISHVTRSEAEWKSLCRPVPPAPSAAKPVESIERGVPARCAREDSFPEISSLGEHLYDDDDTHMSDMESNSGSVFSRPSSRASTVFSSASTSVSTPPASPRTSWAKIAALNTVTSHSATSSQHHRPRGAEILINHYHQNQRHHEQQTVPEQPSHLSYAQALADGLPKRTSTKHGLRQKRCRQRWREERRLQAVQGASGHQ